MKRHKLTIINCGLVATLIVACSPLFGEIMHPYFGAQYALISYDEKTPLPNYDINSIVIRGGAYIKKHLSIEGRIGFGITSETKDVIGIPLKLDLNHLYGIYAVAHIPLSGKTEIYVPVGFTNIELSASIPGVSITDDETKMSYGVGGNIRISDKLSIQIEYIRYLTATAYDIDGISLGISSTF